MLRIASDTDLMGAFRDIDRREVQIPSSLSFPLAVKSYFAWVEPSGHRVYLVFEDPSSGHPLGLVFQRTRGAADTPVAMCQWCHTVRPGPAVSLLTVAVEPNRRIGVHLCSNLNCRENIESGPSIHDIRETVSAHERLLGIVSRMSEFAHGHLL
jgi:hypothetical protein